jgi:hypothetical protein
MEGTRVYRGREVWDLELQGGGLMPSLRADLEAQGFSVNYEDTVRMDTVTSSVSVYKIEPPLGSNSSVSGDSRKTPFFIVQQRTETSGLTLRVDVEVDANSDEVSILRVTDLLTHSEVVFDIKSASVSCPKTSNCFVDCALKKLCSSLSPCAVMLMTVKAADCIGGTKAGCLAIMVDLLEAAWCLGVDCALQCGTSNGCAHSECSTGVKLTKSCSSCAKKVCDEDSYCCNNKWDSTCVKIAKSKCGSTCK